jgi:uncharacterized membrane protein YvbJ
MLVRQMRYETKECGICGSDVEEDATYCPECGTDFNEDTKPLE